MHSLFLESETMKTGGDLKMSFSTVLKKVL